MTNGRIEKAIEIINYAIKNKISVREASVKCGHSFTYVKNVKAIVYDLYYKNNAISSEFFTKFDTAYKNYEKTVKHVTEPTYVIVSGTTGYAPTTTHTVTLTAADIPKIPEGEKTKFSVNEDEDEATADWTWNSNLPPDHIKTLEELLEACNVDLSKWRVESYIVNKWDVTSWKTGSPVTVQNYQVKARLERNRANIRERIIGEMFQDMAKTYKPPLLEIYQKNRAYTDENNLFEVSIFDLHIGKLAWGGETGENYDVKIARERFLKTVETLIQRANGFQYSRILFPVGNDFFNSDNLNNTTTKGTPQDEDLRWQKTFNIGVRLLIDAINMLKQTGVPVDVVVIPGNHDFERSYYMGSVLEAWFHDDKQVDVNNGASPRKYYKFGKVLLGLTHGGEEKEISLPMIMATDIESKPMWSETLYHEWHLGHIHRKRNVNYAVYERTRTVNEELGVIIRYLSSLTGTEEWHHKKGFVGAIKAGEGFIWNDELGLVAHLNSNLIIT
jgi:hypothetical protein